jgi:type IV pilus assembly protein PilC
MGKWRYEGFDKDGKKVEGVVDAGSDKEVRRVLRAKSIRPKKITAPSLLEFDIGEWMVSKGFAQAFGFKDLALFTKNLSTMIEAGVPIISALEILYKSEQNPSLKRAIKGIASDVEAGKTISEAMSRQKGFDKLYCNLVKAGEAGGILDKILIKLTEHMEKIMKTKAAIKSALTYPVIVVIVGIAVIWGLMVFVVPQFVDMLANTGQEPPWITMAVVRSSELIAEYTPMAVPGVIVFAVLLSAYIKTPTGKIIYDNVTMRVPIFGMIVVKGNLSTFSRTLATMLSSGVSLIDSLDIVIETIDNQVIAKDLQMVKNKVVEGKTLTEPLEKIKYFPEMVAQMIKVGEQTGQVDQMLDRVSSVFEEEVSRLVGEMTKMIEPLIIVVLGGIIAFILVAMYLPIFMSAGGT